jgi:hypothetical protein
VLVRVYSKQNSSPASVAFSQKNVWTGDRFNEIWISGPRNDGQCAYKQNRNLFVWTRMSINEVSTKKPATKPRESRNPEPLPMVSGSPQLKEKKRRKHSNRFSAANRRARAVAWQNHSRRLAISPTPRKACCRCDLFPTVHGDRS